MKKYILIIVVGISVFLGVTLLQAPVLGPSPPLNVRLRVRDQAIDVSWEHNPDNPYPVDTYRVYYGTSSGRYDASLDVPETDYRTWTELTGLTNTDTYFVLVTAIVGETESDTSVDYEKQVNPCAPITVDRSITGGTTTAAYTMISTPVEPADTRMSAVLGTDLGPYDNTQWRCFHWEPDKGVYEEGTSNNDIGPNHGEPIVGDAAWLISRDNVTIHSTGCKYDYNNTRDYKIHLAPGWNQIGCPFNFAVAWNDVMVTDGDSVPVPASSPNDLCGEVAWFWSNGAYYAVINLVPMHGCFVYNKTDDDITLIVPHNEVRAVVERDYSAEGDGVNYNLDRTPSYEEGKSGESPPPPPGGIVSADLSEGGGGGCFIATAAFGTPMATEVKVLSKFRDEYLLTNPLGRCFVKAYYKTSPPIADFIRNKPLLKAIVRTNLKSFIWFSNKL